MPELQSRYAKKEEIPAGYEGLYVERYNGYDLTGIVELDVLRGQMHELKKQVSSDEAATRARIDAAVARVTREVKSPSLWRSLQHAAEAIRRAFSKAPLGNDYLNPWSREGWNITQQGYYLRKHGQPTALTAAKSVGSYIGATRPPRQLAA